MQRTWSTIEERGSETADNRLSDCQLSRLDLSLNPFEGIELPEPTRRLRGTDKYFPMDSGPDETHQEGAAGASVAAASERKVPTLSAIEDLSGATNGTQQGRG